MTKVYTNSWSVPTESTHSLSASTMAKDRWQRIRSLFLPRLQKGAGKSWPEISPANLTEPELSLNTNCHSWEIFPTSDWYEKPLPPLPARVVDEGTIGYDRHMSYTPLVLQEGETAEEVQRALTPTPLDITREVTLQEMLHPRSYSPPLQPPRGRPTQRTAEIPARTASPKQAGSIRQARLIAEARLVAVGRSPLPRQCPDIPTSFVPKADHARSSIVSTIDEEGPMGPEPEPKVRLTENMLEVKTALRAATGSVARARAAAEAALAAGKRQARSV